MSNYNNCVAAANTTSALQFSWYTRATSISMYTIWAGYTATFLWFSLIFLYNRKVQPIKCRSPVMVLSSALGGWILATNYTLANYVTGMHLWPCPFTNWALWLGFPLFLLPYPIRALHLFLLFHRNVNKVRDHKVIVETEKLKLNKVVRSTKAKLAAQGPSFRNMQIPLDLTMGHDEEEEERIVLKTVSSNKWHSLARLERYLPHIFFALIFISFIIGLVRQFIPELGLGPECVGCMVTQNQAAVQSAFVLLVILTQLISVLLLQQQQIFDQYKIAGELKLTALLWVLFLIPASALAIRGLDCATNSEAQGECIGSFPTFTDFCYKNFVAQHWLILFCCIFTFGVTVMAPVVVSIYKGRKKILKALPKKNLFPKFKALETLQDCLEDEQASNAFQEFCVQSFCVELVLFWRDAEAFRYFMETKSLEMRVHAINLYIKYLDASGSLFIEVPEEIQAKLDAVLADAAARYQEEGENFDLSTVTGVTGELFVEAQEEIFRQMEEEVFAQFKQSDAAKELFKKYQVLTATAITFQQQSLL